MRHRLDGHNPIGLGFLALVEPSDAFVDARGMMSGFDKGPPQVLVAVLAITFPFLFAIAHAPAVDATGIGRELAHPLKALDRPRLVHDRHSENPSDAIDGEQLLKSRLEPGLPQDFLFQPPDLFVQALQHRTVALHAQKPVGIAAGHLLDPLIT